MPLIHSECRQTEEYSCIMKEREILGHVFLYMFVYNFMNLSTPLQRRLHVSDELKAV